MYNILGTYNGVTETLEEALTYEDAVEYTRDYKLAYGPLWTIWYVVNKY